MVKGTVIMMCSRGYTATGSRIIQTDWHDENLYLYPDTSVDQREVKGHSLESLHKVNSMGLSQRLKLKMLKRLQHRFLL